MGPSCTLHFSQSGGFLKVSLLLFIRFLVLCFVFEVKFLCVVQTGSKPLLFLPQPPKCKVLAIF